MFENNDKYFEVLNDIKKTLLVTRNKIAIDLKMEFPNIKGMSARNLRYMQKFAAEFDNDEFLQHHVAKLPWNHN